MSGPLNLARRPLRNERLPTLLLALACAILALLSVRHAVVASQLRHGGARDVEGQVGALDGEIDRLRAEAAELAAHAAAARTHRGVGDDQGPGRPPRVLLDGPAGRLETALPPTVRLVSIAPTSSQGPMIVALDAVGRSAGDAFALMKALQASPAFEGVFLDGAAENADGVQITCSVRYVGRRPGSPAGAGGAAPERVPPAVAPASTGGAR